MAKTLKMERERDERSGRGCWREREGTQVGGEVGDAREVGEAGGQRGGSANDDRGVLGGWLGGAGKAEGKC